MALSRGIQLLALVALTFATLVRAQVTIDAPVRGAIWQTGSSHTVRWTIFAAASDPLANGFAALYLVDGITEERLYTISTTADNAAKQHTFTIPANFEARESVKVKWVHVEFPNGQLSDPFSIYGDLAITSPDGGEVYFTLDTMGVAWSPAGRPQQPRIRFDLISATHGETGITAAEGVDNTGSLPGVTGGWVIPEATNPGTDYRVRYQYTDKKGILSELSTLPFTIYGHIKVTSASKTSDGSSILLRGDQVSVTWSTGGIPGAVAIAVVSSTGEEAPISQSVPNTGSYTGLLATEGPTGTSFRVMVTHTLYTSQSDVSDFVTVVGDVRVVSPADGDVWSQGSTHTIGWNTGGRPSTDMVSITLTHTGRSDLTISASTANDGEFLWAVPDINFYSPDYHITIQMVDDVTNSHTSGGFAIVQPMSIIEPTSTTVWEIGQANVQVRFTTGNALGNVRVELVQGATNALAATLTAAMTPSGGTETVTWTVPAISPGVDYRIRVSSVDIPNNFATSPDFRVAGSLVVQQPAGGEVFMTGDHMVIEWDPAGRGGTVAIDLVQSAITTQIGVAISNTPAAGTTLARHVWPIPKSTVSATNSFQVRVRWTDNSAISAQSPPFSIYSQLSIEAPTDVMEGTPLLITWGTGGVPGMVSLFLAPFNDAEIHITDVLQDHNNPTQQISWTMSKLFVDNPGTKYEFHVAHTTMTRFRAESSQFPVFKKPEIESPSILFSYFPRGAERSIVVRTGGLTGTFRFTLYKSANPQFELGTVTNPDGDNLVALEWTVPQDDSVTEGGNSLYTIRVSYPARADVPDIVSNPIQVVRHFSKLQLSSVEGHESTKLKGGDAVEIEWDVIGVQGRFNLYADRTGSHLCPADEFACGTENECIDRALVCDRNHIFHCSDGSDEECNQVLDIDCGLTGQQGIFKNAPIGSEFLVSCPGDCSVSAVNTRGCNPFTDGTSVCAAAQLAGITGILKVRITEGRGRYKSCSQNGFASSDFTSYPRSFTLSSGASGSSRLLSSAAEPSSFAVAHRRLSAVGQTSVKLTEVVISSETTKQAYTLPQDNSLPPGAYRLRFESKLDPAFFTVSTDQFRVLDRTCEFTEWVSSGTCARTASGACAIQRTRETVNECRPDSGELENELPCNCEEGTPTWVYGLIIAGGLVLCLGLACLCYRAGKGAAPHARADYGAGRGAGAGAGAGVGNPTAADPGYGAGATAVPVGSLDFYKPAGGGRGRGRRGY